jgi:hypothetical protein
MACFAAALLLFSFAGPALELRAGVRAVEMASRLLFLAAILICATKPSTRWLATCLATGASAFARSELLPSFVAAALFDAALILCAGAVTVRAIVRALAGNQRLRCSVVCLLMGFFFADVFITSAAALARRVEFAATSEMPQQQLAGFFFSYPGNYWRDCPLREGAQ